MKIKCFGIAKDIIASEELEIKDALQDVAALRNWILDHYPAFAKYKSCMIAVNQSYAEDHLVLDGSEEIAIIPPVSGG